MPNTAVWFMFQYNRRDGGFGEGGITGEGTQSVQSARLSFQSSELGPRPLSRKGVLLLPPLGTRGRHTRLRGKGWGTQIRRRDTLWYMYTILSLNGRDCRGRVWRKNTLFKSVMRKEGGRKDSILCYNLICLGPWRILRRRFVCLFVAKDWLGVTASISSPVDASRENI